MAKEDEMCIQFCALASASALKSESDVSGGLNDSLNDLRDVFIFLRQQMIAKNGLLEFRKRQMIGNKSFARLKIGGHAINREPFQIMKSQMRDGIEHHGNGAEMFGDVIIPCLARHEFELQIGHIVVQLNKEARINFATTQHIAGFTRHAASMIFTHPLQIMRIVPASFKLAGVPRPKALALSAEHLITPLGFVNGNLAIWAWFCVRFKKGNRRNRVRIAHMVGIIAITLEFPTVCASVFFTDAALPCGRDETVAVGISAAMYELIRGIGGLHGRVMPLQLALGLHEIVFAHNKRVDLRQSVLDLAVNVLDEFVMNDGGLSSREHGLFLSK